MFRQASILSDDLHRAADTRDRDRWIEALLGGRLRFHAQSVSRLGNDDYWRAVYVRWAVLYNGNPRVPGGYAYESNRRPEVPGP